MPNDREELTKALLETNSLFNKITALQINGVYNSNVFNVRRDTKILIWCRYSTIYNWCMQKINFRIGTELFNTTISFGLL